MRCTGEGKSPQTSQVADYMGNSYETVHVDADVETALAEVPGSLSPQYNHIRRKRCGRPAQGRPHGPPPNRGR